MRVSRYSANPSASRDSMEHPVGWMVNSSQSSEFIPISRPSFAEEHKEAKRLTAPGV